MTSEAQREANARNALRSTGPRSVEGKARSSRNALKHGGYAGVDALTSALLFEEPDDVEELRSALLDEIDPQTNVEQVQADLYVRRTINQWRVDKLTTCLIDGVVADSDRNVAIGRQENLQELYAALADAVEEIQSASEPTRDYEHLCKRMRDELAIEPIFRLKQSDGTIREPRNMTDWGTLLVANIRDSVKLEVDLPTALRVLADLADQESQRVRARSDGNQAMRVLERFERIAALHDRMDRGVTQALRELRRTQASNEST